MFLPAGDLGTHFVLWNMRHLVNAEMVTPAVRGLAVAIVADSEPTDRVEQAYAIRDYLLAHTRFLADPSGVELLHGPRWMVARLLTGATLRVDCDDIAILSAALAKAVGLRARFVVVGFRSPRAPFKHVWTEVAPPGSPHWVEMDLTRDDQPDAVANIRRTYVMGV